MRAQSPSVCPANSSSLRKTVARPCSAPVVLRDAPAAAVYNVSLAYYRQEAFKAARVLFEKTVRANPSFDKAWVSYAMMEKRASLASSQAERFARCRAVLQRGLQLNPCSPRLLQAFGLMELQRGNWLAALMLLERSVRIEPRLQPVLNWALVDAARQAVGSRHQRRRKEPEGAAGSMPDTTPCSS
ncbi:hypothetical protein V8C86DRAFT_3133866 [Haematococcus lacustris]